MKITTVLAALVVAPLALLTSGCMNAPEQESAPVDSSDELGESTQALGEVECGTQALVDIPTSTTPSPAPAAGSGWGRIGPAPGTPGVLPWSSLTTPGASYALNHDCKNQWVTEVNGTTGNHYYFSSTVADPLPTNAATCSTFVHEVGLYSKNSSGVWSQFGSATYAGAWNYIGGTCNLVQTSPSAVTDYGTVYSTQASVRVASSAYHVVTSTGRRVYYRVTNGIIGWTSKP